jgi:NAD(P)-dependent dehydrogenase (short-subunit alcohol dehydrogenase family)
VSDLAEMRPARLFSIPIVRGSQQRRWPLGLPPTEGLNEMEAIDKSAADYAISCTPLGRLGKAEDIANAVAFPASADASWVTGDALQVGGCLRF